LESAYFTNVQSNDAKSDFAAFPNGTECRLTIDGQTYSGVLRGGLLRIGRRTPFASFSAAYQDITGRITNNYWKAWEVRPPGSADFVRGDEYRKSLSK